MATQVKRRGTSTLPKPAPEPILLATMTFVAQEEKKTCWAYRRQASEDDRPKVLVSNGPEMLYVRKSALTGAQGLVLRVTMEVLP